MNTLAIARLTFREALRRKALLRGHRSHHRPSSPSTPGAPATSVRELETADRPAAWPASPAGQASTCGCWPSASSSWPGSTPSPTSPACWPSSWQPGPSPRRWSGGRCRASWPSRSRAVQVVLGKWLGGAGSCSAPTSIVTGLVTAGIVYWRAGYLAGPAPPGARLPRAQGDAALLP